MKPTRSYRIDHYDYTGNGDDSFSRVFSVKMPKEDRQFARQNPGKFKELLVLWGWVKPSGCHCSSCQRGWDCCGNWFPSFVRLQHTRRGVKVTQTYFRNI